MPMAGTPMADNCGFILVSADKIVVRFQKHDGSVEASYDDVTVENLQDAARILAAWMEMKYADRQQECLRVHARDQEMAFLRECVEKYARQSGISD